MAHLYRQKQADSQMGDVELLAVGALLIALDRGRCRAAWNSCFAGGCHFMGGIRGR